MSSSARGAAIDVAHPAGASAEDGLGVVGGLPGPLHHLEDVAEDVGVVVRALIHAAAGLELGHQGAEHPQAVEGAEGLVGAWKRHHPGELVGQSLARRAPDQGRVATGRRGGRRIDREPRLPGDARQPQQAHRVVRERRVAHQPQAACGEVGEAAVEVDHRLPPLHRQRQRVHGEVAAAEVLREGGPLEGRDVDLEGERPALDPPRAERARQPEARGAVRSREGAGGRGGVAAHRDVEVVGRRPARERVADAAAHHPRIAGQRRERCAEGVESGRAHPSWTRGTRGPTAQVTS